MKLTFSEESSNSGSWRCPAGCGASYTARECPREYLCFCRKTREPSSDPEWSSKESPHSCGEVCAKPRANCRHKCNILCHPGPCPDCPASVKM